MHRRSYFLLLFAVVLGACRQSPRYAGPAEHYRLRGVVKRLRPESRVAVIQHETIRGDNGKVWMEAMTMDFPVRDPAEFQKLAVGQSITARVNQVTADYDYWLDQIEIQPAGAAK